MLGQHGNDFLGQAVLTANVGQRSDHLKSVNDEMTFCLNVQSRHSGFLNKTLGVASKVGQTPVATSRSWPLGLERRVAAFV
jgi:hypothetical protein